MNPRIEGLRIKGYEIIGYIYAGDLIADELKRLGVSTEGTEWANKALDVTGEFHIEWDDDIPEVYLDAVYVQSPDGSNSYITLGEDRLDYDEIQEEIQSLDSGDWAMDRQAALIDYAYDSMQDR